MKANEMLKMVRTGMVDTIIKEGVKSIYLNKWNSESENIEDEGIYELDFSEISSHQISVMMDCTYYDSYLNVVLDTIVYDEEDDVVYMSGHVEDGEDVEEIYFDDLNTDDIAKIADAISSK